jgi:hypothetical protein
VLPQSKSPMSGNPLDWHSSWDRYPCRCWLVAADECGVNSEIGRLLRGFVARSGFVYAIVGVAVYFSSSAFWALRIGRVPLPGALLGIWGSLAAFNTRSLVWRSLPIDISDIAIYRWWAAVGVADRDTLDVAASRSLLFWYWPYGIGAISARRHSSVV